MYFEEITLHHSLFVLFGKNLDKNVLELLGQWLASRHQCGNCQPPQANRPHPNELFHKIKPQPPSNGEKKILFKHKLTYKGNEGLKNCSQPTSSAKFSVKTHYLFSRCKTHLSVVIKNYYVRRMSQCSTGYFYNSYAFIRIK